MVLFLFSCFPHIYLVTPLQLSQFQAELCDYPDQSAVVYVLTDRWEGFYGFDVLSASLHSASFNVHSALEYVKLEVSCGRATGFFPTVPVPELHINPFEVIPQNH